MPLHEYKLISYKGDVSYIRAESIRAARVEKMRAIMANAKDHSQKQALGLLFPKDIIHSPACKTCHPRQDAIDVHELFS